MGVWEWGCGDRDEGIGIQACRNGDAGMQSEGMDEGRERRDLGMQRHRQRVVRMLWPHPHPSGPAQQVQGCLGPPSSAPQSRQCPPLTEGAAPVLPHGSHFLSDAVLGHRETLESAPAP